MGLGTDEVALLFEILTTLLQNLVPKRQAPNTISPKHRASFFQLVGSYGFSCVLRRTIMPTRQEKVRYVLLGKSFKP